MLSKIQLGMVVQHKADDITGAKAEPVRVEYDFSDHPGLYRVQQLTDINGEPGWYDVWLYDLQWWAP